MTKNSDGDKVQSLPLSKADEAFLRLVEDSFEAAGQPKDQGAADQVWQKLSQRLPSAALPKVTPLKVRNRSSWFIAGGSLAAAAAIFLFLIPAHPDILPGNGGLTQTRSGAAGYQVTLKLYEELSSGQQQELAGASATVIRHVVVKITANKKSFLGLWRQQVGAEPELVQSLSYQVNASELQIMSDQAAPGTRYCILGAEDEEGLKHLTELILQIWQHLPEGSCRTVPS